MLSYLRLLFSKRYWRHISLRALWRQAAFSLRRAHKDPRARKFLLRLVLLLFMPFLCVAYLAWIVGSGGVWFLIPALLVAWWIRYNNKRNEPVHITPQPEPPSPPLHQDSPELRAYLGKMGILYAVMLDRAGSEVFLREKVLPPNIEIVSRRTHIDLLRASGIWDSMASPDREAAMIADGHWSPELIAHANAGIEPLRLLRWVLRVDFFLALVGMESRPSYSLAHEIVREPARFLEAKQLIDWNALNTARKAAQAYFYRCLTESISRGYFEPNNEEAKEWADGLVHSLKGKQGEDLLIGSKIVSEAGPDELSQAMRLARTRMNFLAWIENLYSGSAAPPLPFSFPSEPVPVAQPEAAVPTS